MVGLLAQAVQRVAEDGNTLPRLDTIKLGPVTIEAIKQFGVDGIGSLQAALIVPLPTVGWKLLRLGTVQVGEGPGDSVAGSEVLLLGDRLEETPTHDLETLLGTG